MYDAHIYTHIDAYNAHINAYYTSCGREAIAEAEVFDLPPLHPQTYAYLPLEGECIEHIATYIDNCLYEETYDDPCNGCNPSDDTCNKCPL